MEDKSLNFQMLKCPNFQIALRKRGFLIGEVRQNIRIFKWVFESLNFQILKRNTPCLVQGVPTKRREMKRHHYYTTSSFPVINLSISCPFSQIFTLVVGLTTTIMSSIRLSSRLINFSIGSTSFFSLAN